MSSEGWMLYCGPLERPGHYLWTEGGYLASLPQRNRCPWQLCEIDGTLQPGSHQNRWGTWVHGAEPEGEAVVHHKDGWTALSFWDRTIDTRHGSSSTYIAEGILTFEQMVALAKERFPERWGKMKFEVRPFNPSAGGK